MTENPVYKTKTEKGGAGEQIAAAYLMKSNYTIIATNFHSRNGEIDIIAFDLTANHLVFVEVKFYKENSLINPIEMITSAKQLRLIKTARYFLYSRQEFQPHQSRFDVIIVENLCVKEHLKNVIGIS